MLSLILVQLLIKKLQNLLQDGIAHIDSNLITTAIELLESLQPSLRHALDNRPTDVPASECRMADLHSSLCIAEDAIDTFIARIKFETDTPIRRRWGIMCSSESRGSPLRDFHNQMKTFGDQLRNKESEIAVSFPDMAAGSSSEPVYQKSVRQCWERISGSCLEEDAVVDFLKPDQRNHLNQCLNDDRNRVIILTGGAGSGKTTLAKLVYKRPDFVRKFRIMRYWVCASEIHKSRDVMAEILNQVFPNAEEPILESGMIQMLAEKLGFISLNNYTIYTLVVIDDVRSHAELENIQAALLRLFKLLENIQAHMFRNGVLEIQAAQRIKVIITSRISTAYSDCVELTPLNEEDSWALFTKKNPDADASMKDLLNHKLDPRKVQMDRTLKLCQGIPLAIGLVGSLYSIEKSDICDLNQQISSASSENMLASVSLLCYQCLSSSLKPCFLYMGLFPRGFEIPVRRLYRLWEAEGFLPEDEADKCFQELVNRNLIEVAMWRPDGRPKTCRLPNTLHEVFSQKAKDNEFFHILPSSLSSNAPAVQVPKVAVRRLVAYNGIKKYPPLHIYEEHLRTFISFNTRKRGTPVTKELNMFLESTRKGSYFTLLKILDLENVYKPVLPEAMGKVFPFLKYLGLRSTALTRLSDSIGELSWLQMLDVKHTFINSLPTSILKLDRIIHLYLNWSSLNVPRGSEVHFPTQLRTVWGLSLSRDNRKAAMKWLEKSTGIRKLGLQYLDLSADAQREVMDWVLRQTDLESLKLKSTDEPGRQPSKLVLKRLADKLGKLTSLYLAGILEADAVGIEMFPSSLKMLTLSMSKLETDPMPELGRLPHLNTLGLFGVFYSGNTMTWKSGGFPELRVLKWMDRREKCEWNIEEAAMPRIRQIIIRNSDWGLSDKVGIKQLMSLEELRLDNKSPYAAWGDLTGIMESERSKFVCLRSRLQSRALEETLKDAVF